jgi:hypothetical protein
VPLEMTEGNHSNVGHRGPVYKGLGAMNPCDLSITEDLNVFMLLTAVWNISHLDNSKKVTHYCVSMATLNGFILLTVTYVNNNNTKAHIVSFVWQKLLRQHAVKLRCNTLHILLKIE